jgi:4,5-DOPA dioxygenase extradiol
MQPHPGAPPFPWALRFEAYVSAAALAGDPDPLVDFAGVREDAIGSVPTPEHYLPLLYAFGAGGTVGTTIVSGIEASSISMLSLRFD